MGVIQDFTNTVELLKVNHSAQEIASMLSCDVESIEKFLKHSAKQSAHTRPGKKLLQPKLNRLGRPRATSPKLDEVVAQFLADNAKCTASQIRSALLEKHGVKVSQRTLQRRMTTRKKQLNQSVGENMSSSSAAAAAATATATTDIECEVTISAASTLINTDAMLAEIKQTRLAWALAHQDWTAKDWRMIYIISNSKKPYETGKVIYEDTLTGPPFSPDLNFLALLMEIVVPKLEKYKPQTLAEFTAASNEVYSKNPTFFEELEEFYATLRLKVQKVIENNGGESTFSTTA